MTKQKLEWHTESRRVDDLIPYEKNPRKISDEQINALKRSFKRFNLVELPAIDADNRIIAGHQRLKVLQLLGRGQEEVECRMPNRELSEKEYKAYLLTSNAVRADWDYEILRTFDTDLLLSIGFNEDELSHVFDNLLETEDDGFNVEKELARIKKPTVNLGDLYQLGHHRLICSDSQDPDAIRKLVGNERIDLIDFDPPYNISLKYEGTKGQYGGTYQDNKTDAEYSKFLKALLQNSLAVAKENTHCFVWCDQNYIGLVQSLYDELGVSRKRVCTWIKNNQNPTPQVAFNKAPENCVYGVRGKPYLSNRVLNLNEIANKEVNSGARTIDDIVDLFEVWLAKRIPGSEYEHPTQKPVTLHEKALRRCSRPGDAILDVCGGSGSLLVACEQMKRRAFLSEVDPIFATLILNRYEKTSGKKAKKLN